MISKDNGTISIDSDDGHSDQDHAPTPRAPDGPTRKHARTKQHRWHHDALAHYHRYNMNDDAPT